VSDWNLSKLDQHINAMARKKKAFFYFWIAYKFSLLSKGYLETAEINGGHIFETGKDVLKNFESYQRKKSVFEQMAKDLDQLFWDLEPHMLTCIGVMVCRKAGHAFGEGMKTLTKKNYFGGAGPVCDLKAIENTIEGVFCWKNYGMWEPITGMPSENLFEQLEDDPRYQKLIKSIQSFVRDLEKNDIDEMKLGRPWTERTFGI